MTIGLTRSLDATVPQIDSVRNGQLGVIDDFEHAVAKVLDAMLDILVGCTKSHVQSAPASFRRVNWTKETDLIKLNLQIKQIVIKL